MQIPSHASSVLVAIALGLAPCLHAQDAKPAAPPAAAPAADTGFYKFVNATGGKFTDDEISWTQDGKTWHTLKESPTAPVKMGGGGRIYVKMENAKTGESYKDFIEFAHNHAGWFGNTTQVDAFVIPLTIEIFDADGTSHAAGITQSRSELFKLFAAQAPAEFKPLVQENKRIVSPHISGFQKGQPYGNYFDKYVDEIWDTYAKEKTLPSGWTGKVVDGALIFSKPGSKDFVLKAKPTTQDILLGTNELGHSPAFCAAFNRHVAADPGDWNNPATYYKKEPYNFYAKFWHEHTINGKAYGFCYDDVAQQDTLIHAKNPTKLVVTLYWDTPPKPAK